MAAPGVKTRVLIVSDTHCAPLRRQDNASPFSHPLPAADLMIHCGDLTYNGTQDQYDRTLDMLKLIDAPVKVVIAGNHDLSLDRDFVFSHRQRHDLTEEQANTKASDARSLWTAPDGRAKREGVTFLDEGVHHLDLPNGSRVTLYASSYTPEFQDWAFPYERDQDRFNTPTFTLSDAKNIAPYPVPSYATALTPIHLLITHGPPHARLDRTASGELAGCEHLLRAVMQARPLIHCFGHIHEGWGAELVKWSKDADHVTTMPTSSHEWRNGGWKAGVEGAGEGIVPLDLDLEDAKDRHAVFLDFSSTTGTNQPLKRGSETLMINAAIMDVKYKPVNAPFIVDIDLPMAGIGGQGPHNSEVLNSR